MLAPDPSTGSSDDGDATFDETSNISSQLCVVIEQQSNVRSVVPMREIERKNIR